ncbi:MAG: hypothetical protein JXX14_06275 [Deltaproteobacteria bacterium]|nr:hypothetical protein [Deltaproteobacteria bacterium]
MITNRSVMLTSDTFIKKEERGQKGQNTGMSSVAVTPGRILSGKPILIESLNA